MTKDEKMMVTTMLVAVSLWVCGDMVGVSSVMAGMIGLSILLFTGERGVSKIKMPHVWQGGVKQ